MAYKLLKAYETPTCYRYEVHLDTEKVYHNPACCVHVRGNTLEALKEVVAPYTIVQKITDLEYVICTDKEQLPMPDYIRVYECGKQLDGQEEKLCPAACWKERVEPMVRNEAAALAPELKEITVGD